MEAINQIGATEFGPSFLPKIQEQIEKQGSAEFVILRLGPAPWWNTRLHLAAALGSDFTEIRQFVLVDAKGRFLTMAPPTEIRRALAKALPKLEMVYLRAVINPATRRSAKWITSFSTILDVVGSSRLCSQFATPRLGITMERELRRLQGCRYALSVRLGRRLFSRLSCARIIRNRSGGICGRSALPGFRLHRKFHFIHHCGAKDGRERRVRSISTLSNAHEARLWSKARRIE
jgi:hypothetical protein